MSNDAYLGIDASKGYADFILLQSNKDIAEQAFRLYDVSDSHLQLSKLVDQWLEKGYDRIYCGMESTGGYENNWVNFFQQIGKTKPISMVRLNPKGVKSLGEAALRRTITDSISAENIGLYLIDFKHNIHYLQPSQTAKAYNEGRKHNSLIRMLKKPKVSKIKGISSDKAQAIVSKLADVNTSSSDHIHCIIKNTVHQILHLEQSIKTEKVNLYSRFRSIPEAVLLTSITGIGDQNAVEIVVEIEDINRFESAKKLGAYFGTHPMFKQSGDGTWGNHMSKKGRSEIRGVLYMCCMSAARHDEIAKQQAREEDESN